MEQLGGELSSSEAKRKLCNGMKSETRSKWVGSRVMSRVKIQVHRLQSTIINILKFFVWLWETTSILHLSTFSGLLQLGIAEQLTRPKLANLRMLTVHSDRQCRICTYRKSFQNSIIMLSFGRGFVMVANSFANPKYDNYFVLGANCLKNLEYDR